jgi:hypothetical protein
MGISKRTKSVIAGLVGVIGLGAAVLPSTGGAAPGAQGSFTGVVQPGFVSNGCLTRTGTGAIASDVTIRVNPGGVGRVPAGANKVRVSFGGNVLPTVVLSPSNQWKYTYPAGGSVPCQRLRSVVTFQPINNSGAAVGTKDTDTLGLSLCASPCK